jgi:uncharacterized oligopeptide transporter (OPT) family protein
MEPTAPTGLRRLLPKIGSPGYHLLLAVVAVCILGPLGGISAAYMNFSIGFFVGGQVLAGILGSAVTLGYGPEGRHGANYMQTMAASVAGMCGMGVLIQAMAWMKLPEPPAWKMIVYFTSIGMFGVGVGMLYTPILVDRMRLSFPSGYAVANILRALTDSRLLRRSIGTLGGGMAGGYIGQMLVLQVQRLVPLGVPSTLVQRIENLEFSASTFGAGLIVGARIAIPALVVAVVGEHLKPFLVGIGWLEEGAPFRKIGFIIALGTILGAAIVDIVLILVVAARQWRAQHTVQAVPAEDWKRVNMTRLVLWVVFWGLAVIWSGSSLLGQPALYLALAIGLCFLFVLVNGISLGISDSNPISSAFVLTVFILAAVGLRDPGIALMCASILLIACSEGGDMQQDRSTGWRLGTNRVVQFRYQVIGIVIGAVLAVALARVFLDSYPVLRENQLTHANLEGAKRWQSAMTYKFVGAIESITSPKPHVMHALWIGVGIGLVTELLRKFIKGSRRYREFAGGSRCGKVTDFAVDAVLIPSPYASSFGGFVEYATTVWWTAGGVLASVYEFISARFKRDGAKPQSEQEMPPDMSATSLVGGGLIAGESLAMLTMGLIGLWQSGILKKWF